MKEHKDKADITEHLNQGRRLRLVPAPKQESIYPDPELKALIEKMKGKPKRVRLTLDDGPEAA